MVHVVHVVLVFLVFLVVAEISSRVVVGALLRRKVRSHRNNPTVSSVVRRPMLSFLFDTGASARKKALRKNQREIQRLIRELDRERTQLERSSSALSADLKRYAKEQNMSAMRTIAKSIVRNRSAVTKLHQIKSQLQAVSLRMAEVNSQQAIGDAMRGTTRALGSLNRRMLKSNGITETLKEFERQKMYVSGGGAAGRRVGGGERKSGRRATSGAPVERPRERP